LSNKLKDLFGRHSVWHPHVQYVIGKYMHSAS